MPSFRQKSDLENRLSHWGLKQDFFFSAQQKNNLKTSWNAGVQVSVLFMLKICFDARDEFTEAHMVLAYVPDKRGRCLIQHQIVWLMNVSECKLSEAWP